MKDTPRYTEQGEYILQTLALLYELRDTVFPFVLDNVDRVRFEYYEREFDQSELSKGQHCGTFRCVAGWAAELRGQSWFAYLGGMGLGAYGLLSPLFEKAGFADLLGDEAVKQELERRWAMCHTLIKDQEAQLAAERLS